MARAVSRAKAGDGPRDGVRGRPARWSRGQILVLFTMSITLFLLICALVIDVAWYWASSLRVQRAADAAALAGVVYLPGNLPQGVTAAKAAITSNGYTDGTSGVRLTAVQDPDNERKMDVTLSAPVPTFFMRLIGINTITASRAAKAEYILPVPMGSPLNYYGVYQLCSVSGTCSAEPDAVSGTLASQGFFGAIEGEGANRSTGDAFATYYNNKPTLNGQYQANGYDYSIVVPQANGRLWIYDPTFCATATKTTGSGHAGAGDHWLGPNNPSPVSIYYQLWNTNNTPFDTTDDFKVADSGSLFANENQLDSGTTYGSTTLTSYADQGTPSGYADCKAGAITNPAVGGYWHNRWWSMQSGLAAGTYRLRVMTSDPANQGANVNQSFENMFSLEVTGGGQARIYGNGEMETYASVDSGAQIFYLAQISQASGAGKTMEIDLFDPGDVGQNAWLQILSPDGSAYHAETFSYTADSNAVAGHTSGTNVTCIQTFGGSGGASPPSGCPSYTSGGSFYNNSWITIQIPLPTTYGSGGLTPPGETQAGWWKVKYTVQSANDTTTWMVSLRGNPVHLVVP